MRPARKPIRALSLALALTISLTGQAFAVSSTAVETLTVQHQITMTGVPVSITYPSGLSGHVTGSSGFDLTVATNNPTGYTLDVSATDLIDNWAGNWITASNRIFAVSGSNNVGSIAVKWIPPEPDGISDPGGAYVGPAGSYERLVDASAPTVSAGDKFTIVPFVRVPVAAHPGTYQGSVTFRALVNP